MQQSPVQIELCYPLGSMPQPRLCVEKGKRGWMAKGFAGEGLKSLW